MNDHRTKNLFATAYSNTHVCELRVLCCCAGLFLTNMLLSRRLGYSISAITLDIIVECGFERCAISLGRCRERFVNVQFLLML